MFRNSKSGPTIILDQANSWRGKWLECKARLDDENVPNHLDLVNGGDRLEGPQLAEWHIGIWPMEHSFLVIADGAWKRSKGKPPEQWEAAVGWVISKGRTHLAQKGRTVVPHSKRRD